MNIDSLYKLIGILTGITALVGIPIGVLWTKLGKLGDKVSENRSMLTNRYTKEEVAEHIDYRMQPFQQSVETLNESIKGLTFAVESLNSHVRDLQLWREREIGRGERGNGK